MEIRTKLIIKCLCLAYIKKLKYLSTTYITYAKSQPNPTVQYLFNDFPYEQV